MKRFAYNLTAALLLLLGTAGAAEAQATKYAQAGMGFLKIDVSARSAAMGGTYMGEIGTANAMFANPAGLGLLEGFEATGGVVDWIADISMYGAGIAFRAGGIGTFGLNFVSMDYGDMRRTIPYQGSDPAGRNQGYIDQGMFTVSEYAIGLTYARQITGQFYVGGGIRFAHQDLGSIDIINEFDGSIENVDNALTSAVFDFGTVYYPGFRDLRFGVSLRNFANQNDYYDQRFELPLTFDFGVAMDLLTLFPAEGTAQRNSELTLAVDWLHPRDYDERLHVGLEYGFMDVVYLRGGYKFNYDEEGLTAGVGVNVSAGGYGLRADYAYSAFGDFFGSVNRVALSIYMQP